MPKPNIFISHRWLYKEDYYSLTKKFREYGFAHLNYSVPSHDPFDIWQKREIRSQLIEQVRQCNYFIIFARLGTYSEWTQVEVEAASNFKKPILAVKPHGYLGGIPKFIQNAENQGGVVGFNAPAIIRKIRSELNYWEDQNNYLLQIERSFGINKSTGASSRRSNNYLTELELDSFRISLMRK
ncbi:MAG TPA: TIR domain-containing protein [Thiobacillaceae bacterium]|nr:TIR domain-containing protein [Thiobacillaceae bacterium]